MSRLTTLYCTDEDLIVFDPDDYALLVPEPQRVATGTDGAVASASPWTLTSAAVDFASRGCAAGQVCVISQPGVRPSRFSSDGKAYVIESVASGSLVLRMQGKDAGIGEPPGTTSDLTGLTFAVLTMGPQIEEASYQINQLFNIDAQVADRGPDDLYDIREVRLLCVLMVLIRRLLGAWRKGADRDLWQKKAEMLELQRVAAYDAVALHWGDDPSTVPPTTKFGTRLSR